MALPLAIPLAMGAAGLISSAVGARKAKKAAGQESDAYQGMANQANERFNTANQQSGQTRNMFMDAATQARDFNPAAEMQTQAGAMMNNLTEQYGQAVNARNSNNNARGMFNSGMGVAKINRNLDRATGQGLAEIALQGANMRQRAQEGFTNNVGQVYNTDVNQGNMFYNAAQGAQGAAIGSRAAGAQAGADMYGQIGGAMMGAAGATIPYLRRRPTATQ